MHFFLYEWATGGGLVGEPGALPASLVREGASMVGALAADLVRIDGSRVTAMRDPRVLHMALPGCEILDVQSAAVHWEEFERLVAAADMVILIAPEFDRILLRTAQRAIEAGGTLISPSAEFIRTAADKHKTAKQLLAAGVRVPAGVLLEPEQRPPADFDYPAVVKPVDGAGSQNIQLLVGPHDEPAPYPWPRRLEQFKPGQAVSVALLCGPSGNVPLAAAKQRITDDGQLRYLGGELPLASGLAERAVDMATRAIAAMPPAVGFVGVDLVLGRDPHGDEDFVIEINPRLTTSYVGLRALAEGNLAEAMVGVARGDLQPVPFTNRPLEFDVDGNVSFLA